MIDLHRVEGFEWDPGNARKNEKHGVTQAEAEQIFVNEPLLLLADDKHSHREARFYALGKTNEERLLHISFTFRGNGTRIRIISARPMHRKERSIYEQKTP
ncbi:MAG: BrnT family toxin [Nitrospirae bacterium]|nr:MAG: BrnT family toxin [Nitrospirota bacterium]